MDYIAFVVKTTAEFRIKRWKLTNIVDLAKMSPGWLNSLWNRFLESVVIEIIGRYLFNQKLNINTLGSRISGSEVKRSHVGPKALGSIPACKIIHDYCWGVSYWNGTTVQCLDHFSIWVKSNNLRFILTIHIILKLLS